MGMGGEVRRRKRGEGCGAGRWTLYGKEERVESSNAAAGNHRERETAGGRGNERRVQR